VKKQWGVFFIGLLSGSFLFTGLSAAEDVSSEDQGVQKVGVSWNMAKDRKIENDGGLYQPEGLDKYMRRLVDELDAKVDQLIQQNGILEKKIDMLLQQNENLEKKLSLLPSKGAGTSPASDQSKDRLIP